MVPTWSVHGPNMVEFKENHNSTGQGQGYQEMWRLNRWALGLKPWPTSTAFLAQGSTGSTTSWHTITVTSVQVLRPKGKDSFKALLECTNEMKLRLFNVLCASMVIVPRGVATFKKPV